MQKAKKQTKKKKTENRSVGYLRGQVISVLHSAIVFGLTVCTHCSSETETSIPYALSFMHFKVRVMFPPPHDREHWKQQKMVRYRQEQYRYPLKFNFKPSGLFISLSSSPITLFFPPRFSLPPSSICKAWTYPTDLLE